VFFVDTLEVEKRIKVMRKELEKFGISEELRGYNWDSSPVEPVSYDVKLSVSDFCGVCQTMRDVYLKYVEGVKPKPNVYMLSGLAYHEVIKETLYSVKKMVYQNPVSGTEIIEELFSKEIPEKICSKLDLNGSIKENCEKLFKYLVIQCASQIDRILAKYPYADADCIVGKALPPIVERKVDGSLIGLSENLSVDFFIPYNAIADLKSGDTRDQNYIALAGYALALESDETTDINFGFIVYLRFKNGFVSFRIRHVLIGDELRRKFLELRDEMMELVESGRDPGKPDSCPKNCCFYGVCNESGS
jgi:CRISPR-associated protein Csa1